MKKAFRYAIIILADDDNFDFNLPSGTAPVDDLPTIGDLRACDSPMIMFNLMGSLGWENYATSTDKDGWVYYYFKMVA